MFAITSFRYIEILFDNGILLSMTGAKEIVRYTEDFVIKALSQYRGSTVLGSHGQHSVGIEPYMCSVGYIERLWPVDGDFGRRP